VREGKRERERERERGRKRDRDIETSVFPSFSAAKEDLIELSYKY
jgi:hypothetical protein